MKTDLTNPSGFQLARRRRTSDAQRQEVTTARFCEKNPNAEHDNDLKLSGGCEGGHSAPLRCAGLGIWTLIPGFPSRPASYLSASRNSGVSCEGLYPICVGNSALSGHGFGNFIHNRSIWR